MRSPFFPRYSEEDLLNREYSFMSRLHVIPPESMVGKAFFYHSDMIQKDIIEEQKAKRMRDAMPGSR
jgi:hypothetical protein